ncbi:hypothetical protein [Petroclostridium sp. X23]|uniref:hypothetical protein n=1 Tax=Petroclostridium sp. X23 TaxID=3045146 RepID=UPI0024ADBED8|nr:hypothetical protein [Petroclostridium sp. X23]WHH59199.1 hypothetical protein QKW49_00055 [Petroclostridium sp. X23]
MLNNNQKDNILHIDLPDGIRGLLCIIEGQEYIVINQILSNDEKKSAIKALQKNKE